jgi:hypothetical protein
MMSAFSSAWNRVRPRDRVLLGLVAAGCLAWAYHARRIAPVREDLEGLRREVRLSQVDAGPSESRLVRLEALEQELQELRAANRSRLRMGEQDGKRAVLAVLAQVDGLIAASRMVLVSREGADTRQAKGTVRRPPGMQRESRPAAAPPEERRLAGLPDDIAIAEYRHRVTGEFHEALQLVQWLNAMEAPCHIGEVVLEARDRKDARGGLAMEFLVTVYHVE